MGCDEFSCRLVLPRHRGYLAKLRLGDGITINLDRQVFAQIEEGMREALKNKEGRSRISTQDRKIANAVIRKARRKPKAKGPKKPAELETTEETLDKKEEENRPIPETNEGDTSMPVLERRLQEKTVWTQEKSLEVPWRWQKWTCHWHGTQKVPQRQDTDSPWSLPQENQFPP